MSDPLSFKVRTAARTDPGRDPNKQVNEDAFRLYETNDGLLVVVCDGMGGHQGGSLASAVATKNIELDFHTWASTEEPQRLLADSIQRAAVKVYELGGNAATVERPGTTCVAAWMCQKGLFVAHVGDSRAYRFRSGTLMPLTLDHTVVEAWIAAGQISREQAKGHPDAHRITRALGIAPSVEVELRPLEELRPGDRYLFCTDGLTDMLSDSDLTQGLSSALPLDTITENFVALANQRGGHDNITVIVVEVEQVSLTLDATQTGTLVGQPATFSKTMPLGTAQQPTVLMNESAPPLERVVPAVDPTRNDRTQPLRRVEYREPPGLRPLADSFVPHPRGPTQQADRRKLWLALALGIALSLLAIFLRLLRHRNG